MPGYEALLGAICKLNSNGPEMTVDGVDGAGRLRVVWFYSGALCEANVAPQSILLREPILLPDMLDTHRAAIRGAHEAAMAALERLKERNTAPITVESP